jgi:hypothetical protein
MDQQSVSDPYIFLSARTDISAFSPTLVPESGLSSRDELENDARLQPKRSMTT